MTITWLSHDHHMTVTSPSHDHHMTVTSPSHDHHMDRHDGREVSFWGLPHNYCSTDDREDLRRLISCGAYFLKMNRATCWHSSGVLECVKIQLLPAWGKDMKSNYWTFLHSIHRGTHRDRVLRAGIHDGPDNVAKLDLQGVIDALLL